MSPLVYHGVSCAREDCNWTGETVRGYEHHLKEAHA